MNLTVAIAKQRSQECTKKVGSWSKLCALFLLLTLVVVSALSIIYAKDLTRRSFSELQQLQQKRDHLQVAWSQLLLEQSTWTTQARIQTAATKRFNMVVLPTKTINMLSLT